MENRENTPYDHHPPHPMRVTRYRINFSLKIPTPTTNSTWVTHMGYTPQKNRRSTADQQPGHEEKREESTR